MSRSVLEKLIVSWLAKIIFFVRSSLFWDITQSKLVVSYRRFGTIYRVPSSRVKQSKKNEDGTDSLSRNFGN